MDNYDLTVRIVETVVKEMGGDFDLYWDELRNPILNLLEEELPLSKHTLGEWEDAQG